MQPNQEIESKEDLLSHFGSSKQLEIGNIQQIKNLLEMNVPPEVWEEASNKNLLSFNQELVLQLSIGYIWAITFSQISSGAQYILKQITYFKNCINSAIENIEDILKQREQNLPAQQEGMPKRSQRVSQSSKPLVG
ncbi:Hypothetical_protein [Hexamita inflata]|uniref:Hypothetical_protein n=1 Tax=Hexamita inflata TaxID=28002 RepID=A0AA86NRC7_9EUKA|nr:Hypothetical protein HINF_LOCUS11824 [Hexamita inflata]